MKTVHSILLSLCVSGTAMAAAQQGQNPLATVTVRSYPELLAGMSNIVQRIDPETAAKLHDEMQENLGTPGWKGIAPDRPWQLAAWQIDPSSPPLAVLYVPISSFSVFEKNLSPDGAIGDAHAQGAVLDAGTSAAVVFSPPAASLTAAMKKQATDWRSPAQQSSLAVLHFEPNEPLRQMLLGGLAMGKGGMLASMQAAGAQQENAGFDPAAIGEMMVAYFDLIEIGFKGLGKLTLEFQMDASQLTVKDHVVPVPDSELAQWLASSSHPISPLLPYLDPSAPVSGAARIDNHPGLVRWMKHITLLNFRMQKKEATPEIQKAVDDLFKDMFPVLIAGSASYERALTFSAVYQFPGRETASVYAGFQSFFEIMRDKMAGPGEMYSSITLDKNHHETSGVPVDRYTFEINKEHPQFQMPGQQELLNTIWPGGKLAVDYAVRGDKLFLGSTDRMGALLEPAGSAPSLKLQASPQTALIGHINPLFIARIFSAAIPGSESKTKALLQSLDPAGNNIEFKTDLDGALHGTTLIPLSLFSALGKIVQAEKAGD